MKSNRPGIQIVFNRSFNKFYRRPAVSQFEFFDSFDKMCDAHEILQESVRFDRERSCPEFDGSIGIIQLFQ